MSSWLRRVRGAAALGFLAVFAALLSTPLAGQRRETAVFAGGCYWGVEAVFEHLQGVAEVVSGFAGDIEAVRVVFDPSRISYRQLLQVFFLVAHDPTAVDRQGPDIGPEYRSVVFVSGEAQRRAARAYVDELTASHAFPARIATDVATVIPFRLAPDQDYVALHPNSSYVVTNDLPKLAHLRQKFPALYRP